MIAMIAGILSAVPLGIFLLGIKPFAMLAQAPKTTYMCSKKTFWRSFGINGGLTITYLGLVMVIFGIHVYLVPIDKIFPMMMVKGVIFRFLVINIIGFFIFRGWMKKQRGSQAEANYQELGISKLRTG